MSANVPQSPKRILEPYDRVSEVLFGLIMVLTFTGSLSVAEAGQGQVRTMLVGALGCNTAWGIIDAIFYLLSCLAEKGKEIRTLRAVKRARDPRKAHQCIAESLPATVAATLQPDELETIRQRLIALPDPPRRAHLSRDDWRGAHAVFGWVFVTTLPVALPFVFMNDVGPALRVSNAIAIAMLYATGWAFGRIAGHKPWLTGVAMVFLGAALVGLTIALGG